MRHLESSLQIHCVRWFRLEHPDLVIFSIPNGGKRSAITAKIMKAEGQMSGVADLFVMCSKKNYHGLWIEMKVGSGKQSDTQKYFQQRAIDFGYKYDIARSFDEFVKITTDYLK